MKIRIEQKVFLSIVFLICFMGAVLIDPKFCPDEDGRQLLTNFIFTKGTLPTGDEPETMIYGWGFSYALRPYLSAIIGAFFMKLASFWTSSKRILLVASRMCSVLSITGSFYFCSKIGNELFRKRVAGLALPVIVCFIPQVMFVGMFQNNDALSLFAVSMETYWLIKGFKDSWSIKSCIWLGVSMAIGMLSYYPVYPWILLGGVFCIYSCIKNNGIENKRAFIIQRSTLVISVVFILAGWFFIRNAVLHNGDFLGISSEVASRERMIAQGEEVLFDYIPGKELMPIFTDFVTKWIQFTAKSFIGYFGYLEFPLSDQMYENYLAVIMTCIVLFYFLRVRERISELNRKILIFIGASSAITTLLSVFQSYFRDYQAQGRYLVTVALLLGTIVASLVEVVNETVISYQHESIGNKGNNMGRWLGIVIIAVWLALFYLAAIGSMSKMVI